MNKNAEMRCAITMVLNQILGLLFIYVMHSFRFLLPYTLSPYSHGSMFVLMGK